MNTEQKRKNKENDNLKEKSMAYHIIYIKL